MNATELRNLERRIDRARRQADMLMKAADQMRENLSFIEALVRDGQQPIERPAREAKPRGMTAREFDALADAIIERVQRDRPPRAERVARVPDRIAEDMIANSKVMAKRNGGESVVIRTAGGDKLKLERKFPRNANQWLITPMN